MSIANKIDGQKSPHKFIHHKYYCMDLQSLDFIPEDEHKPLQNLTK